jgi:methyl-galactoside transport system ATP-binding protein
MGNSNAILEMKHISKQFPGVKALDDVSLKVHTGTVHAIMGENGAGKSTLMKCAFGIYRPDAGEIFMNGEPVTFSDTRDAIDQGISMIHQELQVVRSRNIMENVWLGRIPYKKTLGIKWVDKKTMYVSTVKLFKGLGIDIDPKVVLARLSVSFCQLIEIVRAISCNARIIIMDEPTSSLSETEAEMLFKIIRQLTSQGIAIIYISHKIEEILQIADEVTIMRDGMCVGSWPASELDNSKIINRMVGREMTNRFPKRDYQPGEVHLEVKNLTSNNPKSFRDVSFSVRKGEIFGIGGLIGAQRTEMVESIFGLRGLSSGNIVKDGKPLCITCPRDAIRNGFALLTEERRITGIIPMLSIVENTVIANQTINRRRYTGKTFLINKKKRYEDTQKYIEALSVKTPSLLTQIQYLSGGNQQKVVLARWLLTDPDILFLDEPTRGIDIGAKYEIYSLLVEMAKQGKSIIIVCSEMPELIGMSDRVMVMCEGHVSGILEGDQIQDQAIMHLASSYTNN